MKIAILVPSLRPLAPVQVAISIGIQLALRGHEVSVYHFGNEEKWPGAEGIQFQRLSFWSGFPWRKYDIVHSHGFVPDAFVAFRKPFRVKVRSVSTIHNYVFPELKLLYGWLASPIIGTAWLIAWSGIDQLVVLTDDAIKYYRSYFKNKKINRIYNGRDIDTEQNVILPEHKTVMNEMRRPFKYSIGTSSALMKRKRIDILIRHLSRVDDGCLFILGDGPERKTLEDLVITLNLNHRVKFFGHVPQAHPYYSMFDIYAQPSISEGFSLSLIEAALHKKKIVCSDIPSFKEAFNETEVTFFERENELSIDLAIRDALEDNHKGEKAFDKAKIEYSEKRMAEQYEKLFLQLPD